MPSFGDAGSFLSAGSGFGAAFGSFSPATDNTALPNQPGIKHFDTPSTMGSISQMLNDYANRTYGDLTGAAPVGQTGGTPTSLGGDWSGVDQWNDTVSKASAQYGVPTNLIKAVMMRESGGQNLAPNSSFAVGPMQVTTNNWSNLGYDLYDPNQNIMAGAAVLKQMYDAMGSWEGAVRAYLAGPGGAYTNNTDSFGTDPSSYWNDVSGYWNQLNGASGTAGTGYNSGSGSLQTSFGQYASVPDWGEFDAPSSNGYYGYGTDYGMNGVNHTGIDVPMPVGYQYRAPMGGTVTCAGTNNGPGADGGGCAAFNYVANFDGSAPAQAGNGRIELLLDNGAVLIFGHSLGASVMPGQRVNAGDILGMAGGMNSAHIHLEARVRDANTPSGWRIVDPRTVLGGASVPGMGPTGGNPYAGMSPVQLAMGGQLRGNGAAFPSTAYAPQSRWGNTIVNAMSGGRQ